MYLHQKALETDAPYKIHTCSDRIVCVFIDITHVPLGLSALNREPTLSTYPLRDYVYVGRSVFLLASLYETLKKGAQHVL